MAKRKMVLQFKGFSDKWIEYKIKDVTLFHKQGFYTIEEYGDYKRYYLLRGTDLADNRLSLKDAPKINATEKEYNDFKVKVGDFLIIRSGTVGTYGIVYDEIDAIFSSYLINFRFDKNLVNTEYFGYFYQSNVFKRQLRQIIQQSANTNINAENIKSIKIILPCLKEQECIANYIYGIDTLIIRQQRKYNSLLNVKKSLLNKMLSKDGVDAPEIRFNEFNYNWEQRKFTDITFLAGEKNKENLQLESYSISNESGFIPQNELFENGGTMRNADKSTCYIVSKKSFAYNPSRINVGSIGYYNSSENVIVSSLYEVFKTTDDINDRFLWHWFKSDTFQKMIKQFQEGGVRLSFYYNKLCLCSIALPNLKEQNLISVTLDKLDTLISLHKRKLEHLKHIKSAILEKMLVSEEA